MCGIIGSINFLKNKNLENYEWVKSKIEYLKHRGPDNKKIWSSETNNIIFGHTKLSIIDLSKENIQPMRDELNSITLTYNGEIYNYLDLRKELSKNYEFNTNSDTEVIIKSYLEWGEDFLNKIQGMFAFALFDEKREIVLLARDRLGEKPLFYYSNNDHFLFSSELSAFFSLSNINKRNLNETLLNGFPINREETLLSNVNQVEPGTFIKLDLKNRDIFKKKFWDINFNINSEKFVNQEKFDKILNLNIEKCLISDVRTCVTLSGGLDSSLIVAVASGQKKIDTFSIVFKNKQFDERKHSQKISKQFKTNHHEIEIENYSFDQILAMLEKFDTPIFDSSIIPSYILFENLYKHNYKVAIGGDGGDEIFGGYNHYRILNTINYIKRNYFNFNLSFLKLLTKKIENFNFKGSQYLNFLLDSNSIYKIPFFFKKNLRKKILKSEFLIDIKHLSLNNNDNNIIKLSQSIDLKYTLPLSLLNKLDRCSMLNSVESRSPFLSQEMVEFSLKNLKSSDLASKKNQKIFLKKIGKKYLPKDFIYNRKQGFSFPLIDIIKKQNEINKIEEILISKESIFDKEGIKMIINKTTKNQIRPELIFCLLNIQLWINKNLNGDTIFENQIV